MLRRVLLTVTVVVLMMEAFTLINEGRSSDTESRHKRAAKERSLPFTGASKVNDSTTNATITTEITLEVTSTSTTGTTTTCTESSLVVSLTPSINNIDVSWAFNNTCNTLEGFAVSWGEPQGGPVSVAANVTKHTIQELQPCRVYWVQVEAEGTAQLVRDNETATTTAGAPPKVTEFNYTAPEARNVTLTWTRPGTACDITEYIISYNGAAMWGANDTYDNSTSFVSDANSTEEFTVTGLVPYSSYTMCIVALVGNMNGTEACMEHAVETKEDAPSAPTNVSVVQATSRSLSASWSPPEQMNGVLGDYNVSWAAVGGQRGSKTTAGTNLTIDGLDACVTYSVTVTASTKVGEGESSDAELGTTDEEAPPEVTKFNNTAPEARNVTLTWTRPGTACDITEYIISYNGAAMWGVNDTYDTSTSFVSDANSTEEFTVTGLVPYSSYTMCIVALVGNMSGTEACMEHAVETKEDVPSAPTNLTIDNSTETSILVSWAAPVQHNGILLQYNVTWLEGGTNISSKVTNDTLYTIEGLSSCVNYSVTVTASTSIGEGAGSNTSTITADEIPPMVEDVMASDVAAETLTLSWIRPNTTCDVTIYTVTYNGIALWGTNKTQNYLRIVYTENLKLDGLIPYSDYEVCVAANTSAGQGDANCIDTQTEEEEPSEPQNLQLAPTNNSIAVNWNKPVKENGVLLNYSVSWFGDHGVNDSAYVGANNHTIVNLRACVNITVSVAASTSVGFGQENASNSSTLVEVPPLVGNVEVLNVSARNLDLSWSYPDTFCDVTSYTVTYDGIAQWGANETHNNSTTEVTETLSLGGLTPFSKYTVCVAAKSSAGQGNTSCTDTSTEEDAPSEPTNLIVSELKSKKASITWDPPTELNGDLMNYTVRVLASENNTVGRPVTISAGEKRSYSFTDLDPETNYTFKVEACTNAGCSFDSIQRTTLPSWLALIVSLCVAVVVVGALVALVIVKRDALRRAINKRKEPPRSERPSVDISLKPIVNVEDAAFKKHHIARRIEMLKSNEGSPLQAEFEQMEKLSPNGTTNIATSPANNQKNRYINILPFDENIVYLDSRTDNYVNASLVQDYERKDLFIAAQGPMETTVTHFWQLVWEQNVENIVMLANCVENGKDKCAEYWPQLRNTRVLSQHFKIVNCSEEANESFVVRTLEIRYKQSSRFVKQFHYTVWPDFGVPEDGASILNLMCAVKKNFVSSATKADRHILVHCSAGVGRTGTFIGVWNLCHRDLNEFSEEINVMKEVLDMRERRVMMVQTSDQYLMLYQCFLEYSKNVTRWPLPETDATEESMYHNPTESAHGNSSQEEPIYENTRLQQQEPIYENQNPPRQEYINQNRSPQQQKSFNGNGFPRQQGPHYTNLSTPQSARYMNESPRLQESSFRNRSLQREDGIYENDGPPQPPRSSGGYDRTGARREVSHY